MSIIKSRLEIYSGYLSYLTFVEEKDVFHIEKRADRDYRSIKVSFYYFSYINHTLLFKNGR